MLFINGVTNKRKNPRINIGILCYLTTLALKLFLPKLGHGQFQALKWNLNLFAIKHFVLFSIRQHVQVC
jgi:hypothetical protein